MIVAGSHDLADSEHPAAAGLTIYDSVSPLNATTHDTVIVFVGTILGQLHFEFAEEAAFQSAHSTTMLALKLVDGPMSSLSARCGIGLALKMVMTHLRNINTPKLGSVSLYRPITCQRHPDRGSVSKVAEYWPIILNRFHRPHEILGTSNHD